MLNVPSIFRAFHGSSERVTGLINNYSHSQHTDSAINEKSKASSKWRRMPKSSADAVKSTGFVNNSCRYNHGIKIPLTKLPIEVISQIFSFLPSAKDRLSFLQTCKKLNNAAQIQRQMQLNEAINNQDEQGIVDAFVRGALPTSSDNSQITDFNRSVIVNRDGQIVEITVVELLLDHGEIPIVDFFVNNGAVLPAAPEPNRGQTLQAFYKEIIQDPKKLYLVLKLNPSAVQQAAENDISLLFEVLVKFRLDTRCFFYLDLLFSCSDINLVLKHSDIKVIFTSCTLFFGENDPFDNMSPYLIEKIKKALPVEAYNNLFSAIVLGRNGHFYKADIEKLFGYFPEVNLDLNQFVTESIVSGAQRTQFTLLTFALLRNQFDDAIALLNKGASVLKSETENVNPLQMVDKEIKTREADISDIAGYEHSYSYRSALNEANEAFAKLQQIRQKIIERREAEIQEREKSLLC